MNYVYFLGACIDLCESNLCMLFLDKQSAYGEYAENIFYDNLRLSTIIRFLEIEVVYLCKKLVIRKCLDVVLTNLSFETKKGEE